MNTLSENDRAVSPVVGVALLIAVAVILAAVIGAVVLGLGTTGAGTPQAQLQGSFDAGNDALEISHEGGDPIPAGDTALVINGNTYELTVDMTAGESVDETHFDGSVTFSSGDEVTLIWQDPDSNSETVLRSWTV